jgi:hypothetical protein
MPVCLAMGEAAGMAAALAAEYSGGETRAVDVQQLRDKLRTEGAYLPESEAEYASSPDIASSREVVVA